MVCSPEQLAANRRNARLSCGPKTAEGKARSRRNGLKHGLTGEGLVVLDEDRAAVAERFEAFEADLRPSNDVARFLARRAALLSVRMDRSAREEAAQVRRDMLEADAVEEDQRAEEVDALAALLPHNPAEAVRKLRRTPEGIARLVDEWHRLGDALTDRDAARWAPEPAQRLRGEAPRDARACRIAALSAALRGWFGWLEPTDWPELPPSERRRAAIQALVDLIDGEVAALEAARAALDPAAIARLRLDAPARALFNPSRDACLARRYEAAAERHFYRALDRIEAINASAEATAGVGETNDDGEICGELASSCIEEAADVECPERILHPERLAPDGRRSAAGGRWSGRSRATISAGGKRPSPGDRG